MRWLVRLVTPPGGLVLDPFAGSGTTGQAASEEGFDAILIEREAEYIADIKRRLGLDTLEDLLSLPTPSSISTWKAAVPSTCGSAARTSMRQILQQIGRASGRESVCQYV